MPELNPHDYCFACMNRLPATDGVCPVCGHDNKRRANDGDELPFYALAHGKYTVGRALGRGGFGITYIGLNNGLGKRVAIKEYFPSDLAVRVPGKPNLAPASRETAKEFMEGIGKALAEAKTIAKIDSISHVVKVFDVFGQNDTIYIVMEYIDGETLASRIEKKGPMKWAEAWRYMRSVGRTLNSIHESHLVHRDISPDNIMIRRDNDSPELLDFGAAIPQIAAGQRHNNLHKDGYAAFEQYQEDSAIDGRTDEYSFAATLYYMLTAQKPAGSMQRAYDPNATVLPRKLRSNIPEAAQQVLMRAMEVKQEDRYPSMREMVEDMDRASPSVPPKPPKRRGLGAARWICIILMILSGLTLIGSLLIGLLG